MSRVSFKRKYKLVLIWMCIILGVDIAINWFRTEPSKAVTVTINQSLNRVYKLDAKYFFNIFKNQLQKPNATVSSLGTIPVTPNVAKKDFKIFRKAKILRRKAMIVQRLEHCNQCNKYDFHFVLDNEKACATDLSSPEIDVVILIFTVHKHRKHREVIRKTWLSYSKNNTGNVRYAFVLGNSYEPEQEKQLQKENQKHKDIVEMDFLDSYFNLTYKTLMGFQWAMKRCASAKYIMKTDDDVYVNIPGLLNVLLRDGPALKTAVGGTCRVTADPSRKRDSKWYVSKEYYPNETYPGYCSGTGYITSMDMVKNIAEISRDIPYFHLEDVYIALCVRKLGYELMSIPGFHSHRVLPTPCAYRRPEFVTSHEVSLIMMEFVWNRECSEHE